MADNRLNLIVAFTGIDKLTPALKNILGFGKSTRQSMRDLTAQSRDLTKQIGEIGEKMKAAGKMGSLGIGEMAMAQKELRAQLETVNVQISKQKRLMEIDGRTARNQRRGANMSSEGMSTLLWGTVTVGPALYEIAKTSGEVGAMENQLRQFGLNDTAVKNLRNYADAMQVAGSSVKDNMHYLVEAQGIFRESGMKGNEQLQAARLLAPIMARTAVATKALGQEFSDEEQQSTMRFIEMAGGLGSPQKAAALANIAFKLKQSSGGSVTADALQTFMARGGSSVMSLQDSAYADYEPLIATLKDQAGVGNYTAYKRLMGTQRGLPAQTKAEFAKLGLWANGQQTLNAPAAKILSEQGAAAFYQQVLLPAYKKAGIKDVQRENLLLMGGTGGTLYNEIDKANKSHTFEKSRAAYGRSKGIDDTYNQTMNSFFGQTGKMKAAWSDLLLALGTKGGVLDMLVGGLRMATSAVKMLTAAANNHPTLFKAFGKTAVALIGFNLGIGLLKVGFGNLLGPVTQIWGWFEKVGVFQRLIGSRAMGGLVNMLIRLPGPMAIARMAMLALGRGFAAAGVLMEANPIVLIITAVIVVIGLLGYVVYRNWATIKSAFITGWNWLTAKFVAMKKWFTSFGPQIMTGLLNALDPFGLRNKLLDIAKFGVTAFKDFFHIKSPSGLMFAMGGHIATGLGHGIDHHAHRPMRSMQRMSEGMAKSFATGRSGARHSRGGDTHHWHISQRAGEDSRDFARRVVRIMDGHSRGDRLRSFGDDF